MQCMDVSRSISTCFLQSIFIILWLRDGSGKIVSDPLWTLVNKAIILGA